MFPFTIPLQGKKPTADFSFSGLKTAVRLAAEANLPEEGSADWDALTPEQEQARRDIAAGFQKTALQHLVIGIRRGARWAMEEEEGIGCLGEIG